MNKYISESIQYKLYESIASSYMSSLMSPTSSFLYRSRPLSILVDSTSSLVDCASTAPLVPIAFDAFHCLRESAAIMRHS